MAAFEVGQTATIVYNGKQVTVVRVSSTTIVARDKYGAVFYLNPRDLKQA